MNDKERAEFWKERADDVKSDYLLLKTAIENSLSLNGEEYIKKYLKHHLGMVDAY